MTTRGLPPRLQQFLFGLANDVGLSSWKISSQGDNTTVVLRFCTGLPSSDNTNTEVGYRRKPPSQLRRDKERAEKHQLQKQQNKASDIQDSPLLFQPTPEKLYFESSNRDDPVSPTHQQHTSAAVGQTRTYAARVKRATTTVNAGDSSHDSAPSQEHVPASAMECGSVLNDCVQTIGIKDRYALQCGSQISDNQDDYGAHQLPTEEQVADDAVKAGFNLSDIRATVAKQVDRRRQRSLRDPRRNVRLSNVVLDTRGADREELLCDSEDFVLQFDCHRKRLVNWYIKDGLQDRERGYIIDQEHCLGRWPMVRDDEFVDEKRQIQRLLCILAAMVRVYLG